MDSPKRNRRISKELLLFAVEQSNPQNKVDYEKLETRKINAIFEEMSTSKLGQIGYDVKNGDVIKARRIYVWPNPIPNGPIVIEFKNEETITLVKKAIDGAG